MKLKIVRKKTEDYKLFFKLTGEMTVYSAVKLKDVLYRELKSSKGIILDLSEIDEADTSGFQILLFLKREAAKLGKSFRVSEMSGRLGNIFTLYKETI